MKKLFLRAVAAVTLIMAIGGFSATAHAIERGGAADMISAMNKNPEIKTILKVEDGKLISGKTEVVLNGVNLGGWLLMETWMGPVADEREEMSNTEIIEILTDRFGKDIMYDLMGAYEESFITEADFERIASLGFNCIRLPFWYRNFMTENGQWRGGGAALSPGMERLDWVIGQCEKYGIYVILDMHGCPGGQSMNHGTGEIGRNELYNNEQNLAMMERLWTEIAKRYKNSPIVAAYDIMNEPQNNSGYTGDRAWQAESPEAVRLTNTVYDRMIKAIRTVDKRHIITIEGVWTMNVLPNPAEYGWENMMYQLHIYDDTAEMINKRVEELIRARDEWNTAVIVGEYNSGALEEYAKDLYEKNGISRIKWTYKTVGDTLGNWGLYNKKIKKPDIRTATYPELKKIFGTEMRTENGFEFNADEYGRIK